MIQVDGSRQGTSDGSRTCSNSNKDSSAGVWMNLGKGGDERKTHGDVHNINGQLNANSHAIVAKHRVRAISLWLADVNESGRGVPSRVALHCITELGPLTSWAFRIPHEQL